MSWSHRILLQKFVSSVVCFVKEKKDCFIIFLSNFKIMNECKKPFEDLKRCNYNGRVLLNSLLDTEFLTFVNEIVLVLGTFISMYNEVK